MSLLVRWLSTPIVSAAPPLTLSASVALCVHPRCVSTKKKAKVAPKFLEHAQTWRDQWRKEQQRLLADSLRGYVTYSTTRRQVPWDTRFAPFDRQETDGVYMVAKYLMEEKLAPTYYHAAPVKRLFCNVGILGPTVTTGMRWKPRTHAGLPATATELGALYKKDRSLRNSRGKFND